MSEWTKQRIQKWLNETKLDKYQSIQLGHELSTPGMDRSGSFKAALPGRLDGKTFCDIGCSYGAMVFMAEEAGASQVYGYDKYKEKVGVAIEIANIRGSKAYFSTVDICDPKTDWSGWSRFDIVTCFNVLHHLPYPFLALERMLDITGETFVIEFILPGTRWTRLTGRTVNNDLPIVGVISQESGAYFTAAGLAATIEWFSCDFRLKSLCNSPRANDRRIAVFKRNGYK